MKAAAVELGAWVRMKPGPGREVDTTSMGRVIALIDRRDLNGRRQLIEVRWASQDGTPESDTLVLHPEEVEVVEDIP